MLVRVHLYIHSASAHRRPGPRRFRTQCMGICVQVEARLCQLGCASHSVAVQYTYWIAVELHAVPFIIRCMSFGLTSTDVRRLGGGWCPSDTTPDLRRLTWLGPSHGDCAYAAVNVNTTRHTATTRHECSPCSHVGLVVQCCWEQLFDTGYIWCYLLWFLHTLGYTNSGKICCGLVIARL